MTDAILTYGPTLARAMDYDQAAAHIAAIDDDRGEGVIGVVVARSHVPGISNIECAVDRLPPDRAIIALATAATRLAKIHGKALGPAQVLDKVDAQVLRASAERLVDFCRASQIIACGVPRYDATREACVGEIMMALACASVTPALILKAPQ